MLIANKVIKRFGGIIAVNEISLKIKANGITGLIGPNGSGKTTFFNCINGIYRPEKGEIVFDGQDITGLNPAFICRKGIARTFQVVRPFRSLTVKETLEIAMHFGNENNGSMQMHTGEIDKILYFVELYDKRDINSESF